MPPKSGLGRVDLKKDVRVSVVGDHWVKRVVRQTLKCERVSGKSVGVYLTGDRRIRRINKKFLAHDTATDVISFSAGRKTLVGETRDYLGDIVVSVETARRSAKRFDIGFKEELARYLVHGTLHLLGYEDEKPKKAARMKRRQESIVRTIMNGR